MAKIQMTAEALAKLLQLGAEMNGKQHSREWLAREVLDNEALYDMLIDLMLVTGKQTKTEVTNRPAVAGEGKVFPDGNEGYAVEWNRQVCSPRWQSAGAAHAYLDALLRGDRKPEYPSICQ